MNFWDLGGPREGAHAAVISLVLIRCVRQDGDI